MQHQQLSLSTACSTGFDLASTSAACTASFAAALACPFPGFLKIRGGNSRGAPIKKMSADQRRERTEGDSDWRGRDCRAKKSWTLYTVLVHGENLTVQNVRNILDHFILFARIKYRKK